MDHSEAREALIERLEKKIETVLRAINMDSGSDTDLKAAAAAFTLIRAREMLLEEEFDEEEIGYEE